MRILLAALAGCLLWAFLPQRQDLRQALIALDASEVGALCASAGYPPADFWERARVIGVGAVLFREETLGDLMARGDVLSFSREELEKWKAFGLVASAATLKANTIWIKDSRVLARLLSAGERTGTALSTSSSSGYHVIEFTEAVDPAFPAGYNLDGLVLAQAKGLVPILGGTGAEDLGDVGLRWQPDGKIEAYPRPEGKPFQAFLAGRTLGVRARLPAMLRAVYSHPRRLILLRLDPALGLESNLSELRGLLKPLKGRGVLLGPPPAPTAAPEPRGAPWRQWLAWILAAIGPLLAARVGLDLVKQARVTVLRRWPVASPVLELAAGLLCATGTACLVGLAVSSVLGGGGSLGLPEGLATSALAAPLVVGALALYSMDLRYWKRRWRSPLTLQGAARFLFFLLAALLLLKPRMVLAAAGLWGWAERAGEASAPLWWWRWRWREIVIGFPALLQAFFLLERRLDAADPPGAGPEVFSDPRGWLLVGLLGPSGIITALGHPGAPLSMMLGQTVVVVLLGSLLGVVLIGLRGPVMAWAVGPRVSRTIDPDKPI